jgi:2-keto-3-deoxy-L-rhamnonate aldolase RhmA
MSVKEASQICTTALTASITPFVRVPYECGDGYVQKTLDAGARGVIFPHVNSAEGARRLSRVCKYPPLWTRSWTNGLPHLGFEVKVLDIVAEADTGYLSTHS